MDQYLDRIGLCVGILYLWWEYHGNNKVWFASVVQTLIALRLFFIKGLYGDFAINIYYLVIAVYGYFAWRHKGEKKQAEERPITHVPAWVAVGCAAAMLVLWWAIWFGLKRFTNSTVPVCDAFTTALSIVAMWMMARKYAEQWLAWLVVDVVSTYLYYCKGLPFYCTLYAVYCVVAVFGYRNWLRLMAREKQK